MQHMPTIPQGKTIETLTIAECTRYLELHDRLVSDFKKIAEKCDRLGRDFTITTSRKDFFDYFAGHRARVAARLINLQAKK